MPVLVEIGRFFAHHAAYVILFYLIINVVAFCLYGNDKNRARKKRRRIPEAAQLWIAALGGGLGAALAMRVFRHKTKHRNFMILVPLFLVLHVVLVVFFLVIGKVL